MRNAGLEEVPAGMKISRRNINKLRYTDDTTLVAEIDIDIKVTQSYLTLCNPMDCSLPGSSIHRIFQARVLEWVAISFSRAISSVQSLSRVRLFATPWTVAYQAPPSMEFSTVPPISMVSAVFVVLLVVV